MSELCLAVWLWVSAPEWTSSISVSFSCCCVTNSTASAARQHIWTALQFWQVRVWLRPARFSASGLRLQLRCWLRLSPSALMLSSFAMFASF